MEIRGTNIAFFLQLCSCLCISRFVWMCCGLVLVSLLLLVFLSIMKWYDRLHIRIQGKKIRFSIPYRITATTEKKKKSTNNQTRTTWDNSGWKTENQFNFIENISYQMWLFDICCGKCFSFLALLVWHVFLAVLFQFHCCLCHHHQQTTSTWNHTIILTFQTLRLFKVWFRMFSPWYSFVCCSFFVFRSLKYGYPKNFVVSIYKHARIW